MTALFTFLRTFRVACRSANAEAQSRLSDHRGFSGSAQRYRGCGRNLLTLRRQSHARNSLSDDQGYSNGSRRIARAQSEKLPPDSFSDVTFLKELEQSGVIKKFYGG